MDVAGGWSSPAIGRFRANSGALQQSAPATEPQQSASNISLQAASGNAEAQTAAGSASVLGELGAASPIASSTVPASPSLLQPALFRSAQSSGSLPSQTRYSTQKPTGVAEKLWSDLKPARKHAAAAALSVVQLAKPAAATDWCTSDDSSMHSTHVSCKQTQACTADQSLHSMAAGLPAPEQIGTNEQAGTSDPAQVWQVASQSQQQQQHHGSAHRATFQFYTEPREQTADVDFLYPLTVRGVDERLHWFSEVDLDRTFDLSHMPRLPGPQQSSSAGNNAADDLQAAAPVRKQLVGSSRAADRSKAGAASTEGRSQKHAWGARMGKWRAK